MNNTINSPFRYAGGKFYARKLIIEHIPNHDTYCEPFAGGASIFFAKPKVRVNHLNDIDKDLMLVYKVIRDYHSDLIDFLHGIPATKELHAYYKNEYVPSTDIEVAGRWYYLNRTSYSGIMNRQNCYWGYGEKYSMRPENWGANIQRAAMKLRDVKLSSSDFEEIIDGAKDGTFLFIDPPYFNADQNKFYTASFIEDDHYRLEKVLRRNKDRLRLFVTYDNCEEVRNLYNWADEIYDKEWNYTINRTDDQRNQTGKKGKRYKGKEIFILNNIRDNQAETPIQLSLFHQLSNVESLPVAN